MVDVDGAQETGLAVLMDEHFHYEVGVVGNRVIARARIGPLASVIADAARPAGNPVLFIKTAANAFGPDSLSLGFEDAIGNVHVLATLDGRFLSTEVAGGMQGRVLGMYAVGGTAGSTGSTTRN